MKKKILSLALVMALCLTVWPAVSLAAGLPFADVPAGVWFYNDVKTAFESGLINGRSATKFAPDDNLTYAEAVKLAACMHQKYTTGSVTLKNGDPWYRSYVDYAKKNRIISKDYSWNAKATRAGYMEIFAGALPSAAFAHINTVFDNAVRDVQMGHPSYNAIYKLYRAGIVEGANAQRDCRPDADIKRGEVAAILTRMMDPSARKHFTLLNLWLPLEGVWSAGTDFDDDGDAYYFGFLDFYGEGRVEYRMGYSGDGADFCYRGSYDLILKENDPSGWPAGTILFALELYDVDNHYWGIDGLPGILNCAYMISMDYFDLMTLQHMEGDWLISDWDVIGFSMILG